MIKYYCPYLNDNNIYSIDNMRIHFKLAHDVDMVQVLDFLNKPLNAVYYMSNRSYRYQHLFNYKFIDCSFTVGLGFTGSEDNRRKGYIDFNPNKVLGAVYYDGGFFRALSSPFDSEFVSSSPSDLFLEVFRFIFLHSKSFHLSTFDLAVDLKISRTQVQLLKDRRKYVQFRRTSEDFTEYLGCRSSGGAVKIYNKSLESGLDFACTRIELTLDSLQYDTWAAHTPEIYFSRCVNSSSDVLVQLLSRLSPDEFDLFFSRLGRRKKEAVKDLILKDRFVIPPHVHEAVSGVLMDIMSGRFMD